VRTVFCLSFSSSTAVAFDLDDEMEQVVRTVAVVDADDEVGDVAARIAADSVGNLKAESLVFHVAHDAGMLLDGAGEWKRRKVINISEVWPNFHREQEMGLARRRGEGEANRVKSPAHPSLLPRSHRQFADDGKVLPGGDPTALPVVESLEPKALNDMGELPAAPAWMGSALAAGGGKSH